MSVQVVVDVHERRSGVPEFLSSLGIAVQRAHLRVGDYAVQEIALVERKTASDLHASLIEGRLWLQLGRLRHAVEWPYLLIEGPSVYDGPLGAEAVRGMLLTVADLGTRWIRRIAKRRFGDTRRVDRPAYAQRPQRDAHCSPAERALAAAQGVSTTTARALFAEVPGVGNCRANAIRELATSN